MLFLSKLSLSHLSGTSVTIFFILDHSPPNKLQSKKLQEEIQNNGGQANYKVADVTSHEQMEELAAYALKKLGKIDVLVNNAGLMPQAFLYKKKIDEWDKMIDVNFKGVLYSIAAVLPSMRERKSGHIINLFFSSGA